MCGLYEGLNTWYYNDKRVKTCDMESKSVSNIKHNQSKSNIYLFYYQLKS